MQVLIGAIKEILNDTWPMILLSSVIFIFKNGLFNKK